MQTKKINYIKIILIISILIQATLFNSCSCKSGVQKTLEGDPTKDKTQACNDQNATLIKTVADLEMIKENLSGSYCLLNNLDVGEFKPIGDSDNPFTGRLDGNYKELQNLKINSIGESYIGLVGRNSGLIERLTIRVNSIEGQNNVGSIAGDNKGKIENVRALAMIGAAPNTNSIIATDNNAGGLVGMNSGIIRSSYSDGLIISAKNTVGGLVGYARPSSILKDCYSAGQIQPGPWSNFGRLVGSSENASITRCYTTTLFDATQNSGMNAIGNNNQSTIENLYYSNITGAGSSSGVGLKKEDITYTTFPSDFESEWNIKTALWPTLKWADTID